MRICFLTHVYPARSGDPHGVFVEELVRGLAGRGHAVHVVTPWIEGALEREEEGLLSVERFRHAGRFETRLGELKRIPWETMGAFLSAWTTSARSAIERRKLEIVHAYWIVPGGFVGILAGRAAGVPVVASAPGTDLHTTPNDPLLRQPVRWTLSRLDRLIVLGTPLRDRAIRLGIAPHRARIILNDGGTDPLFFRSPGRVPGGPPAAPLLLYVGRLARPKRVDTLLRMMNAVLARLPRARLEIVGDGEEREALEALSRGLGVASAVRFLGAKNHAEIAGFLERATALVYPTENEGYPSAIMEAMAFGVPVVTSRVGGIPDLLDPDRGLYAPPGDAAAFAARVLDLLADEPARRAMAERSRAFAQERFARARVLAEIEETYRAAGG